MLLLFVGSGCAALIYEIVWFQLLGLIVGSSAISMGVLLGTFMGGMCLGSLLLTRFVSTQEHPLRVYARLEGVIGIFGLLVLFGLPYAGGLYVAIGGPGFGGLLVRGLFCIICLLPPTMMMGATLPAISRWVQATPTGVSWLGFFYGGNIVGAVFGCLLAGFYLLRVFDVSIATYVAVALNAAVTLLAFGLARVASYTPPALEPDAPRGLGIARGAWPIYVAIAFSGMTALGAEVIWTRLLSLLLGATVYTFSLVVAAFLIGLGIGSSTGALVARNVTNARVALGWCQLLLVAAIAWSAFGLTQQLPYWPVYPGMTPRPLFQLEIDLVRALWAVLPAALLWGASFPLALAAAASRGEDPGRLVGGIYAANTVGGIVGAMIASLILIPWIGTDGGDKVLIGFAALSAVLLLAPTGVSVAGELRLGARSAGVLAAVAVVAIWLGSTVIPVPALLVGFGRWSAARVNNHGEWLFVGEGMNSSMAVSRLSNGVLNYHNAGKVQASSEPQDMRLQRMLGHLTTLLPPQADSVLVIGFGAGVTAGAVSVSPAVKYETIAEIEPLVPKFVSKNFAGPNNDVANNPKVHIKIDDARHFLLTTKQHFDAITSDPFDPWVKGAATLYTREFFQLAKAHLHDGGVVTVFVQLYESNLEAVKSEVVTFFDAFPDGLVFGNENQGAGYDVVLVGQKNARPIDVDAIEARLMRPEYAPVAQSLAEIGFGSALDLFGTFAASAQDLAPWLADAQVNRDRNLRLQYLAGLGLNLYEQDNIYQGMIRYRRWPIGVFTGSPETMARLQAMIGSNP